jgi:hypothetical protein
MNQKHKKLAEEIYVASVFALAEKGMDAPIFILIKNDKSIPLLIPPDLEIGVAEYASMASDNARDLNADAIIVISGMWVVIDKAENLDPNVKPSDHPNREHYLNLVYMSADGKTLESIAGKVETDLAGHQFVREHEWLESMLDFNFIEAWKE